MQPANRIRLRPLGVGLIVWCLVFFANAQASGSTVLYFVAHDSTHGLEVWKTDGTDAGTVMVKDINPLGSSNPQLLTNVNGTLYFIASDSTHGLELWKSDGTSTGTVMVKDINTSGSSNPAQLTNVNGTLFFTAFESTHGLELWKTNGTDAGTVMVKNINPSGNSDPQQLTNVNGVLYFTAFEQTNGLELWKSNGTDAGTVIVRNINTSGSSEPQQLTLSAHIPGDFDSDDNVDTTDLDIFCGSWLTNNKAMDIFPAKGDGIVNMLDFAVFAENWLAGD